MDSIDAQIVSFDGLLLPNVEDAVRALQDDGGVVLKNATNLTRAEEILSRDMYSVEAITRDVILNAVRIFRPLL